MQEILLYVINVLRKVLIFTQLVSWKAFWDCLHQQSLKSYTKDTFACATDVCTCFSNGGGCCLKQFYLPHSGDQQTLQWAWYAFGEGIIWLRSASQISLVFSRLPLNFNEMQRLSSFSTGLVHYFSLSLLKACIRNLIPCSVALQNSLAFPRFHSAVTQILGWHFREPSANMTLWIERTSLCTFGLKTLLYNYPSQPGI